MDELFDLVKALPGRSRDWLPDESGGNTHRSLKMVYAFIQGYISGLPPVAGGHRHPGRSPEWLSVFTTWVLCHYGEPMMTCDGFTLIKIKVGGNEELAFEEFYRLLPMFEKDIKEIGLDGIKARHRKLWDELRAQHKRRMAEQ